MQEYKLAIEPLSDQFLVIRYSIPCNLRLFLEYWLYSQYINIFEELIGQYIEYLLTYAEQK